MARGSSATRLLALTWLSAALFGVEAAVRRDQAQAPLRGGARASQAEEPQHPPLNIIKLEPKNATVKLFPASYRPGTNADCADDQVSSTLTLPPEVCLSGNYYFDTNVQLVEAPVCRDGSRPYMAVFTRRGCHGERTWYDYGRKVMPACLDKRDWPLNQHGHFAHHGHKIDEASFSHWSLMFYCADLDTAVNADGANVHWQAQPPRYLQNSKGQEAGTLQVFKNKEKCEAGKVAKEEHQEPVQFLNIGAYVDKGKGFLKVAQPAYCPDGSRAQLGLYKDTSCASHSHEGTHDHHAELLDLPDEDMGECIEVGRYQAAAFSCSGLKKMPKATGYLKVDEGTPWWEMIIQAAIVVAILVLIYMVIRLGVGGTGRQLVSNPHLFNLTAKSGLERILTRVLWLDTPAQKNGIEYPWSTEALQEHLKYKREKDGVY